LSFPIVDMYDGVIKSSQGDFDLDEGRIILGDILISMEKAKEQSMEYGHSFERELIFLLTHGVFHLLAMTMIPRSGRKKCLKNRKPY